MPDPKTDGLHRSYRIGFLNADRESPQGQAFVWMQRAARRLGHELIACRTSEDVDLAAPDFVLATSLDHPKLFDAPAFGVLEEGRRPLWTDTDRFRAFLSYDGWLSVSDTMRRFAGSAADGLGRFASVGESALLPDVSLIRADIAGLVARGAFAVCHVGEGSVRRHQPLCLALAAKPNGRVYGPRRACAYLEGEAGYRGPLAFDGEANRQAYAACGAGLVLPSDEQLVDDIPPAALFEICSVGAVAICPDTPWMRRTFGDAVFYYDPSASDLGIVNQIDEAIYAVTAAPEDASRRAAEARTIFENAFTADHMLANAAHLFEEWSADRDRRVAALQDITVDVIVRTGGRPLDLLKRAIDSIDRQGVGRVRVILVRYGSLDVAPLTAATWSRIAEFTVVDRPGGNRSATLRAGLEEVRSDYFAVLDDDDRWLEDHLETLLAAASSGPGDVMAMSGMIVSDAKGPDGEERRHIRYLDAPAGGIRDIVGGFGIHTFLAPGAHLTKLHWDHWDMKTGEDSALIGGLLSDMRVRHTYRATAVQTIGRGDQSNFAARADRGEDLLNVYLRIGPNMESIERGLARPAMSFRQTMAVLLEQAQAERRLALAQPPEPVAMEGGRLVPLLAARTDMEVRPVDLGWGYLGVRTVRKPDREGRAANESWFDEPWLFGLIARVRDQMFDGPQWLVARLSGLTGAIGVMALDLDGRVHARDVTLDRVQELELWLPVDGPCDALVLQCWDKGLTKPVVLQSLWAVQPTGAISTLSARCIVPTTEAALRKDDAGRAEALIAYAQEELDWNRRVAAHGALSAEGAVVPLVRRNDLEIEPVHLDDSSVQAPGGTVVRGGMAIGVTMDAGAAPWTYALTVDLKQTLRPGEQSVVIEFGRTTLPFQVLLLDRAGARTHALAEAPGDKASCEIWLTVTAPEDTFGVAIQHGPTPMEEALVVRRISLARCR